MLTKAQIKKISNLNDLIFKGFHFPIINNFNG